MQYTCLPIQIKIHKTLPTTHNQVDGQWGDWGAWTTCNKSCGGGNKSRERKCNDPAPDHGGSACMGIDQESHPCNPQECPGKKISFYFI